MVLCISIAYWYCVLVLCIGIAYWYCILVLCIGIAYWYCVLCLNGGRWGERTVGEDAVDVQAVRSAGLVVGAAPHIRAELAGAGVTDHPRVTAANLICNVSTRLHLQYIHIDAFIHSDLQQAHLSEEGEMTIYHCGFREDVHRTKCQALTI